MRGLFYSHIFLGFCAVAMTAETFIVYGDTVKSLPYLLFVFLSAFVSYNVKSLLALKGFTHAPETDKIRWAERNKRPLLFFTLTGTLLLSILTFFLDVKIVVALIPAGLISLGYALPVKLSGYTFTLRGIPFLKAFLVALVWTMVVGYIPLLMSDIPASEGLGWMLREFVFLYSLALLFDIKDMETDKAARLFTLPLVMGVHRTKLLSVTLLFFRLGYIMTYAERNFILANALVTVIASFVIIRYLKKESDEIFYMSLIDGIMLVKSATVAICLGAVRY